MSATSIFAPLTPTVLGCWSCKRGLKRQLKTDNLQPFALRCSPDDGFTHLGSPPQHELMRHCIIVCRMSLRGRLALPFQRWCTAILAFWCFACTVLVLWQLALVYLHLHVKLHSKKQVPTIRNSFMGDQLLWHFKENYGEWFRMVFGAQLCIFFAMDLHGQSLVAREEFGWGLGLWWWLDEAPNLLVVSSFEPFGPNFQMTDLHWFPKDFCHMSKLCSKSAAWTLWFDSRWFQYILLYFRISLRN